MEISLAKAKLKPTNELICYKYAMNQQQQPSESSDKSHTQENKNKKTDVERK